MYKSEIHEYLFTKFTFIHLFIPLSPFSQMDYTMVSSATSVRITKALQTVESGLHVSNSLIACNKQVDSATRVDRFEKNAMLLLTELDVASLMSTGALFSTSAQLATSTASTAKRLTARINAFITAAAKLKSVHRMSVKK